MKYVFIVSIALTAGLIACNTKSNNDAIKTQEIEKVESLTVEPTDTHMKKVRYEGILPAADCEGIKTEVAFWKEASDNVGTYDLSQKYLGTKENPFYSSGDFKVISDDATGATYYQLNPGKPDSIMNFKYMGDSIIMVGSDFKLAPSGLNYTLKIHH